MKRPRILLADEQRIFLDGVQKILEGEYDLVGDAEDGRELMKSAATTHPDVVVLEILMPLLSGMEAARQLSKVSPHSKIVFLTALSDPKYVTEAFRVGASAYLTKKCPAAELIGAIREVLRGNVYVTPLVAKDMIGSLLAGGPEPLPASSRVLTQRQREVLQLVAEGHSTKEIAAMLKISPRTVEFHRARISTILGLHTHFEVTRYAMAHGLLIMEGLEPRWAD
jgi:DNA-binding NarL/FixJ family response regulator